MNTAHTLDIFFSTANSIDSNRVKDNWYSFFTSSSVYITFSHSFPPPCSFILSPPLPLPSLLTPLQESLASAEELIKDLEHAEVLSKKHEDFQKDVAANEARLEAITSQAQAMVDEGHSDGDEIQRLTEVGVV